MSTYTDIHMMKNETLAVDANPRSRTTVQNVRFKNELNEYWGTFKGAVQASTLAVECGEISGLNVRKSTLDDCAVLMPDGTRESLSAMANVCQAVDGGIMLSVESLIKENAELRERMDSLEALVKRLSSDMTAGDRELASYIEDLQEGQQKLNKKVFGE